MATEFAYSLDTYPLLYALWAVVGASWLLAAVGFVVRLVRARPVVRFDRPMVRVMAALRDAVAQLPIWRRPLAGVMHLVLMAGAVLALAAFVVTHYVSPRGPEWNRSALIHALADAAVASLLVGLAVAAWRRHRRRELPARLEDMALWGLLLAATLATLLAESLLVTLAVPAWRRSAFLSAALARPLGALPTPLRRSLYGWSWSMLHATLVGSALLLPWTKWRHVLLAPFALLTRKGEPLARLDPLPLPADTDLVRDDPLGARRPRDLTWKERLDVASCVHCGRCTLACPAVLADGGAARDRQNSSHLDPRWLLQVLGIESGRAEARSAAGGQRPLAEICGESVLWECTTCMACDDACPIGISPLSVVVDLRRERVLDAARFPVPLRDLFGHLERRGNPWGLPAVERDAWLTAANAGHAADLRILEPGGETEVLLWLGCMGGYDARARDAVVALAGLLRGAGVEYAILGPDEGCCGDPARRAGNESLWRDLAERNLAVLATRSYGRIVTLCPHCANTLANEYADLGAALTVSHAAPYLAGLLREGRLKPNPLPGRAAGNSVEGVRPLRVGLHDPCYLARGMGDTASTRALLAALPGVQPVELPSHGRDTLCCGAGGGRMWLDGPEEPRLSEPRLSQVVAAGVDLCVTACPYCRTMIADGLADDGGGDTIPAVADLVELIARFSAVPAADALRSANPMRQANAPLDAATQRDPASGTTRGEE